MQFNHKNWVHKVYTILSDESQPGGHFLLEIDNNEEWTWKFYRMLFLLKVDNAVLTEPAVCGGSSECIIASLTTSLQTNQAARIRAWHSRRDDRHSECRKIWMFDE